MTLKCKKINLKKKCIKLNIIISIKLQFFQSILLYNYFNRNYLLFKNKKFNRYGNIRTFSNISKNCDVLIVGVFYFIYLNCREVFLD